MSTNFITEFASNFNLKSNKKQINKVDPDYVKLLGQS